MLGQTRYVAQSLLVLWFVAGAMMAPVLAQDHAPSAPAVPGELMSSVENYWHYGKIARYDLAAAEGKTILEFGADPLVVLTAFEKVAADRKDNLDQWLLRWQGVEAMKPVTTRIIEINAAGYRARRADPKFITEQLSRLPANERAYGLAMSRLRESGELAAPFMIDILRDPAQKKLEPVMRRALRDLGRYGLNPLVAATETKEWDTLTVIVGVIGDLGYVDAAPYVARLFESKEVPGSVRAAAMEALSKLGVARSEANTAADLFYALGEKFYYDTSSISADNRYPTANIWYWGQTGLERKEVSAAIFNELMAMRACEYSLKLGGGKSDALSLWLAANYKREAELPEGQVDSTRGENQPDGHYYGVSAGSQYLNAALARAVKDRNGAVAFKVVRSLQQIIGASPGGPGFSGVASQPLIDAMQFPDRKVRFEAAFALAAAMPQQSFEGSQRVVPLLAEAVAQTGQASILLVMPSQDEFNKLAESLKSANGWAVAGAIEPEAAIATAAALPAVDVILVSEDLGAGKVDQLFNLAAQNLRLAGAARLVMTRTSASIYEPRKVTDPLLSTTTATDAEGLKPALEQARAKAGSLPMDEAVATEYALRAGQLLLRVGTGRGQVYDLSPAKPALLGALNDSRQEIVMLAGQALAVLNDKAAQAGLLSAALDPKAADDVKISLFKSLAGSAKLNGNLLEGGAVKSLEEVVAGATNLEVRSAAAEARGALNLPADQAKTLVVDQAKM